MVESINKPKSNENLQQIVPAELHWQQRDLDRILPVSTRFNEPYHAMPDGLSTARNVFIEHNHLPSRFTALFATQFDPQFGTDNTSHPQTNHMAYSTNFTIIELGFGLGLNTLATWQQWQHTKLQAHSDSVNNAAYNDIDRQSLPPHLHIISTEKYPLSLTDLSQSLATWQSYDASLTPFVNRLLALYPTLVAGCHRLHLQEDVTLDLWLGDAANSLSKLQHGSNVFVDAWYLDGFAPSRNESLWSPQIFDVIKRLSKVGSTVATYSSADVVKNSLADIGFEPKEIKGYGHNKPFLTACLLESGSKRLDNNNRHLENNLNVQQQNSQEGSQENWQEQKSTVNTALAQRHNQQIPTYRHVAIIGSGVSGLLAAWAFAKRGIKVTLLDKTAPLAGASGNPRALLAPKMTPLSHVSEHLHSISYLYSRRLYTQWQSQDLSSVQSSVTNEHPTPTDLANNPPNNLEKIFEPTATLDLLLKANVDGAQINEYPNAMATVLETHQAKSLTGLNEHNFEHNLYLPQAGLINPKALADKILAHPNITFEQAEVTKIVPDETSNKLTSPKRQVEIIMVKKGLTSSVSPLSAPAPATSSLWTDAVIIAAAYESQLLDARIFEFRKIRGQLSWFVPTQKQLQALPKIPLKYGGYCASFTPHTNDADINAVLADTPTFLLGASFVRNDLSTSIRQSEHAINLDKLLKALPELANIITPEDAQQTSHEETFRGWQGRVGIRAQTPDYHPIVGQMDTQGLIWTLSGMGSKGFSFAPLCAEALADMMTQRIPPLSEAMLRKLSPQRKSLQKPLT